MVCALLPSQLATALRLELLQKEAWTSVAPSALRRPIPSIPPLPK